MENLVFKRIAGGIVIAAGVMGAIYCFFYLVFPYNFAFGSILGGAAGAVWYFIERAEKTARLNVFYRAANAFGKPAAFDNRSASFERNGTNFGIEFPRDERETWFQVSFFVPKVYRKFIIQHNALLKKSLPGCEFVEDSPLSGGIFLHADDKEFLLKLLENKNIQNEIYDYPESFLTNFSIVFDEGNFEIRWTPPAGEAIDGLYQVCRTAAVFHDELKKHAKTS